MNPTAADRYRAFRPAWHSFVVYIFGALVFLVGPTINPNAPVSPALSNLIGSLFLALVVIRRFTNLYLVEPDKVVAMHAYLGKRSEEAPISQIRRIDLRRGIAQRALKVAHVFIYVEGEDTPRLKLYGVPQPQEFKQLLLDLGAQDTPVYGAWRR